MVCGVCGLLCITESKFYLGSVEFGKWEFECGVLVVWSVSCVEC